MGFSQGFHLAGFDIICAIDHWALARDSILMNHGQKALKIKHVEKHNYDVEIISKMPDKEFHEVIPDSEAGSLASHFQIQIDLDMLIRTELD